MKKRKNKRDKMTVEQRAIHTPCEALRADKWSRGIVYKNRKAYSRKDKKWKNDLNI